MPPPSKRKETTATSYSSNSSHTIEQNKSEDDDIAKTHSHSSNNTKLVVVRQKYEMCKNWKEKEQCKYGDRCLFAHGRHELASQQVKIIKQVSTNEKTDKDNTERTLEN